MTAEQNYRLLQEIEANRKFILLAYQQNPKLLVQDVGRNNQRALRRMLVRVSADVLHQWHSHST